MRGGCGVRTEASWPMRLGRYVTKTFDYLTDAMAVISGILLFTLTAMTCIAVIIRYFFQLSAAWTTEFAEYFIYLAVVLATPWVLKHDKHVTVDVFINLANPKIQRRIAIFNCIVGIIISALLFYYGTMAAHENYVKGTMIIRVTPIPKYVPLVFIPIMAFFLVYQFAHKLWQLVGKAARQNTVIKQTN